MRIERLTYVTENGEILFHPDGYPSDKGLTIKQLAKNKRWKILNKIARQLANYEQSDNIKQSIKICQMPLYTKRIFKCKDSNIFQLNTFFVILFSHFQQRM